MSWYTLYKALSAGEYNSICMMGTDVPSCANEYESHEDEGAYI